MMLLHEIIIRLSDSPKECLLNTIKSHIFLKIRRSTIEENFVVALQILQYLGVLCTDFVEILLKRRGKDISKKSQKHFHLTPYYFAQYMIVV